MTAISLGSKYCSYVRSPAHSHSKTPHNLFEPWQIKWEVYILLKKSSCIFIIASVIIVSVCIQHIYVYMWMNQQMTIQQWTPPQGRAKAGWPARTYIQLLCVDAVCSPEGLPEAMDDRGWVARESQGYPCWWHDMMMMMIFKYCINTKSMLLGDCRFLTDWSDVLKGEKLSFKAVLNIAWYLCVCVCVCSVCVCVC